MDVPANLVEGLRRPVFRGAALDLRLAPAYVLRFLKTKDLGFAVGIFLDGFPVKSLQFKEALPAVGQLQFVAPRLQFGSKFAPIVKAQLLLIVHQFFEVHGADLAVVDGHVMDIKMAVQVQIRYKIIRFGWPRCSMDKLGGDHVSRERRDAVLLFDPDILHLDFTGEFIDGGLMSGDHIKARLLVGGHRQGDRFRSRKGTIDARSRPSGALYLGN